jgi:hypothetical protein
MYKDRPSGSTVGVEESDAGSDMFHLSLPESGSRQNRYPSLVPNIIPVLTAVTEVVIRDPASKSHKIVPVFSSGSGIETDLNAELLEPPRKEVHISISSTISLEDPEARMDGSFRMVSDIRRMATAKAAMAVWI